MSQLIVWKNQEMSKLRRDLDRLINRCWDDLGMNLFLGEVTQDISVEIFETKDAGNTWATLTKNINLY